MVHLEYKSLAELQAAEGSIDNPTRFWQDAVDGIALQVRQAAADQNMAPTPDRDVEARGDISQEDLERYESSVDRPSRS